MNRRYSGLILGLALATVLALVSFLVLRSTDSTDGSEPFPALPSTQVSPTPIEDTSEPDSAAPHRGFDSLAVGAGGFVTGISMSDDGSTRLVRTDGFGGYRWDGERWVLNVSADTLPAEDVRPGLGEGVLAVAVAPSDGSIAYMAFSDGVYRSDDAGQTWARVLSDVSTAANDSFRIWGSRLAVDPSNPDIVYYGSQLGGMYLTRDGGSSWSRVPQTSLPAGQLIDLDAATGGSINRPTNVRDKDPHLAGAGISGVAVDRSGPVVDGRSQVIYAASFREGLYRSEDAGESWARFGPAQIGSVSYLRVLDDGAVVVTSHPAAEDPKTPSDVWVFRAGEWTQSVPPQEADWRSLAADPTSPGRIAMTASGGRLAVSEDEGASWRMLPRTQSSDDDVPWLAWALNEGDNFMSPGELYFDPVVEGRLWLTEGTGVWYADLAAGDTSVHWMSQSRGIEQLVPTGVVAPPGGKPVMTAWDRPIFRSEDPQRYPDHYGPVNQFGSAWSIDWSVTDPEYLVADVASHQWPSDPTSSGFSTDGGDTWTPFPTIPQNSTNAVTTFGFGSMAVGSPGNVVWVPAYGKRPEYTLDGGKTWSQVTLPGVSSYSLADNQAYYVNRQVIAADKAAAGTFYLYVLNNGTYRSTDGGASWTLMSDDSAMANANYGFRASLKAVPGREGELYLTPGQIPSDPPPALLHSVDAGETWTEVQNVTGVTAFGFGKPAAGSRDSTVFIAGNVDGVYGVYQSDDAGQTWTFLTDYPDGRTPAVMAIDGDKDIEGRVYLAIGGSGWVYGN